MSNRPLTYTSDRGGRRSLTVFAGDTLPKSVREAQDTAVADIQVLPAKRQELDRARALPERLKQDDERAARLGEAFDPKKAAKKRLAAEEAAEVARLDLIASTAKADRSYSALVEAATHHTPAWRQAALDEIDSAMLRVTTAREQARIAGAALVEAMGVVQMLTELPSTGQLVAKGVKTAVGFPPIELNSALDHLGNVIGCAMSFVDDARDAEKTRKGEAATVIDENEIDPDEGEDLGPDDDDEDD